MTTRYHLLPAGELDASLIAAWRAIQAAQPGLRSPFFCPEFTRLVAAVRRDAAVVVIENDGRPVGFLPFQRSRLDGGKPIGGPLSDYHGVIAEPASDWTPLDLMRAARLNVWSFDHLVDGQGRFAAHVVGQGGSPTIDLSGGYQKYVDDKRAAGSDYIRKTEGLARKLAREAGELTFELHDGGAALDSLMRWKSDQYRESGLPDAFAVSWTRKFLANLAATRGESGFQGLCSVLRAGGRIVAVHMGMRSATELHYWFPAYDAEFSKFSPGNILLLRMAEALAGQGVRTIDLGKGDSPYKQRLMTGAVPLLEGYVERPSLLASVRGWLRRSDARVAAGDLPAVQRLPLKVLHRIRWRTIYLD